VALKIVEARSSESTLKSTPSCSAVGALFDTNVCRAFTFDGPNGRHLCIVMPVLGSAVSDLSNYTRRLKPQIARKIAFQATSAIAELHAQSLCHGSLTTEYILLSISDIDHFSEADIYRIFGRPRTGKLV
jgi:serine/threonine-protein kinase SRPK3